MGCKVGELRQLNSLSGGLQIRQLRQVENVDESKGAQMLKKKDLGYLRLDFDYSWEEQAAIEIEEVKRIEGVLEGLQPNANLEELEIHSYPGLTFPLWMSSTLLLCNVTTMELTDCKNCNQLSALGNLESLEKLRVYRMESLKHIGAEFYGVGGDTCFPKLQTLELQGMPEWEDWEIPFSKFKKVMPRLSELNIEECPNLKALPGGLGQLPSLEELHLYFMDAVKHVGADLVQIPDGSAAVGYEEASTSASLSPNVVLFPKLTKLALIDFPEWTEEGECEKIQEITKTASIMPNLQYLWIQWCPKLKVLPPYMFPHSLRILYLNDNQQLKVIPCLPPLLEEMHLYNDLGVVSTSLMSSSCDHDYPNLKTVTILRSPHSSLPQGLSKFTSLQELFVESCSFLDLKPEEELRGFPTLQHLVVLECPVIRERCEREDWANTLSSHIAYNIQIKNEFGIESMYFTKRR